MHAEILLEAGAQKRSDACSETHESGADSVYRPAMIPLVYKLSPHYEANGSFACFPRHRDSSGTFMFSGMDMVALQMLFASICNQHWPCINLSALMCSCACKPFIRKEHPPQLQLGASQPSSKQPEKHKKYQVFYQPVSSKRDIPFRLTPLILRKKDIPFRRAVFFDFLCRTG